ncbi:hypothetical protein [Photobacterium galatheae]|uniref:Thioredoxin-like fold domain-containing protein n=1 Tax=Photobacterium galatheae TaxID=1654360 RepID=A0A066RKG2_9GAMM|nr:hypothetical protein [Photobacterium galatheae]KDM90824.1 hypothetical protein EA58_13770 [Photobacterium galatheae]MCM0149208.1 hypothetical protein [Photobacterium galatheae]
MRANKLFLICAALYTSSSFASYPEALERSFHETRIYHEDSDKVFGYAREKDKKIGSYFTYDINENRLGIGESKYSLDGNRFIKIKGREDNEMKNTVVPYFAKRYGAKFSSGDQGKAYVFLDYSCPFSRAFVQRGQLEQLANDGKEVWVMPMSRDATTEGILNYSALTCGSASSEDKLSRFLHWMKAGAANVQKSELKAAQCYYWLDLKPYYGLISELGLEGVPAVFEIKNSRVE